MGFVHYNCTVAEQVAAVAKVKAAIPGFVVTPVCARPSDPISTLDELKVRVLVKEGVELRLCVPLRCRAGQTGQGSSEFGRLQATLRRWIQAWR
jgi:hypothetical protein